MRLWAEVFNGARTAKLGVVDLAGVSVVRKLDKAGSLMLDVTANDPNNALLRWGRWVDVYCDRPRRRRIGRGILMRQNVSVAAGQQTVSWKCTDELVALQRANTLNARICDDEPIGDVVRSLAALAGWTVKLDGVDGNTSLRFDGVSVLEAIMRVVDLHGYHFRAGLDNQLVFGALGEVSGIRLVEAASPAREMHTNPDVALIENLQVQEDGADVVNWLSPFSGPVDGALTLKRSTRSLPYPIETTTGPNGETVYFIKDDAAIAEDGEIRAVESPENLVFAVSAETTAFINAANVLYDWAATQIERRSQPQTNYVGTVAKMDVVDALIGKKVRLVYKGMARQPNQSLRLVDVDAEFWVTATTERYTLAGISTDVELSNNSQPPRRAEQKLARILKKDGQQRAQMNVSLRTFKDTLVYAGYGDSQTIDFEVDDGTVEVTACRVKLTRESVSGPGWIGLVVDGVEVPVGNLLASGTEGLTVTVDISNTVMDLAEFKGEHTLTITALYGSGNLAVVVSLYEAAVGIS